MGDFDEYEYLEKIVEKKADKPDDRKRDRDREKDKDRDRERDRDRDRERGREKDKDRGKDRDKDRDRSRKDRDRDPTRDRKYRSRSRSMHRDRDRDRDYRRDDRRPPPREATPPEVREQREREKELRELDRDTRTVFAMYLPLRAAERELFEFFSQAGTVVDVKLIMDRNTRKSKGFAYIEYDKKEDVLKALALTGQPLMGQPIMVKLSEAEKNLAWEASQQQAQQMQKLSQQAMASGAGPCKLYVGNLHPEVNEQGLRPLFEPFGPLDSVEVQRDVTGKSLGYGYVQFGSSSDAQKAVHDLDGMDIYGSKLKVTVAQLMQTETITVNEALDDDADDGGGMKLTSDARAALMSRLAGAAGLPVPAPAAPIVPVTMPQPAAGQAIVNPDLAAMQGILGPASPIPTPCLLLKNMFDPAEETEPEWDVEITQDVKEECSKYGQVAHIYVDRNSKGCVYLKFTSIEGCSAAQRALHGRWFAGKQIAADFQFAQVYNNYFKC